MKTIYLFTDLQRQNRKTQRQRGFLASGLPSKCLKQYRLGQTNARSQKLTHTTGVAGTKQGSHHQPWAPTGAFHGHISRKLAPEAGTRSRAGSGTDTGEQHVSDPTAFSSLCQALASPYSYLVL